MNKALGTEALSDRLFDLIEDAPDSRSIQTRDGLAVGSLKGPREVNQDRACAVQVTYGSRPSHDFRVGIICDGMGGMREGGLAASLAISVFLASLITSRQRGAPKFHQAVLEANRVVHDRLKGSGGTTLTAIAISSGGEVWSVHAGDSRLYDYRGGDLKLLTQDDTITGIVNSGNPDQIEDSQDHRLIQFVGIGADLQPHIARTSAADGTGWLLTSDGAHGLGRNMIRNIASNARSVVDLARKILFVVDAAPLGDNASVVALASSSFDAPRRNRTGINITAWTPTEQLELWLFDEEISHVRSQAPDDPPLPAQSEAMDEGRDIPPKASTRIKSQTSAKTTSRTKSKTTRKTRPKAGSSDQGDYGNDDPNTPLLRVVFGRKTE